MNTEFQFDVGFVGNVPTGSERERLLKLLSDRFTINDYRRTYAAAEISSIYANAKIVFNHSVLNDLNMRVFESMACGAMLVTQYFANGLTDLFDEGIHFVQVRTDQEMVDKIDYYLKNESQRQAIAQAGYEVVVNQHTYDHRCETILQVIFEKRPDCRGPLRNQPVETVVSHYLKTYSILRLVDATLSAWSKNKSSLRRKIFDFGTVVTAAMRKIKHG